MKVVKSNSGQLCNKIWSYTFLIAHTLKFKENIFINGVYHFENSVYKNYMDMIDIEISNKENKEVSFLICSAEKIDVHDFPGLDCFQIPSSTSIEDLYCLSLCNYIIGPPSTFSMWASFYGKVPLRIIKKNDEIIAVKQFKTIIAVDVFDDGSTFTHDVN